MMMYCPCGEPIQLKVARGDDGWGVPEFYAANPLGEGFKLLQCPNCAARLALYTLTSKPPEKDFSFVPFPSDDDSWLLRET